MKGYQNHFKEKFREPVRKIHGMTAISLGLSREDTLVELPKVLPMTL